MAVLMAASFFLTTNGLYFWFNLGEENRLRFEYGRIVWRHVDGGTARTTAGVDGGASRVDHDYERKVIDPSRSITRIPLWIPFLAFVGGAVAMTFVRRSRHRRADTAAGKPTA